MITLGLDLGTNSIGWAIVNEAQAQIIGTGVRIFQEGVNIDAKSKAETPRNAKRREYRQKRRQLFRRGFRNKLLTKALRQAGMFPAEESVLNGYWLPDPYQLRKRALDEKLTLHELGRALLHLNQRRGFRSSRKAGTTSEETTLYKGGEGKAGITETQTAWEQGGFRTFGEYLASLDPHVQRQRNRYTLRKWYEDEMDAIWQAQAAFHPEVLTQKLRIQLADPSAGIVFYQRPLRSQKHLLGKCALEPKQTRCPVSHPDFEEFRMWAYLNNLKITGPGRVRENLDDEEKTKLVELFLKKEDIKLDDVRKALKLSPDYTVNFFKMEQHEQDTSRDKLKGNTTTVRLRKLFGPKAWELIDLTDRTLKENQEMPPKPGALNLYDLWHTFFTAQDPDWLKGHARQKWGFDDDQLKQLAKTHLPEAYAHLSRKAIRKLLPHMEKGLRYDEAALAAGYHHSQISEYELEQPRLPEPKNVRNPIVQQALYELRTLVNRLMDEYGRFDIIRVELARDLKASKDKRRDIRWEQKNNEREREGIAKVLAEHGLLNPSREDYLKYQLWQECRKECPYTGEEIRFQDLFRFGRFDIEHILPESRTLDNSRGNKTLCQHDFNRLKHNRTPYELFRDSVITEAHYQQILDRVRRNLPRQLDKFKLKELPKDDFLQKQLNDTRYISREAKAYLRSICPSVQVVLGSTTAPLRRYWGLNSVLAQADRIAAPETAPVPESGSRSDQKNRDDHRHHAVDALVVACTDPRMLQELSRWSSLGRQPDMYRFELPWPAFFRDAVRAVAGILVSIKKNDKVLTSRTVRVRLPERNRLNGEVLKARTVSQRSVSPRGQLHKETVYGKRQDPISGQSGYHVRKNLADLTPAMISRIIDQAVRELIKDRLRALAVNPDQKKFEIPKNAWAEPIYLPNRKGGPAHQIKSVRIREVSSGMKQLKGELNQWVEPGSNHHVAVYEEPGGALKMEVIPFWVAVERKIQKMPVVARSSERGGRLLASWQKNDMYLLGIEEERIDWHRPDLSTFLSPYLYRVQKLSDPITEYRKHNASTIDHEREMKRISSTSGWFNLSPIKVVISPTGCMQKSKQL